MSHRIISIGRQFGSGGHQIGLKTAEALGVRCYDKELITLAALRGKMDPDWTSDFDEQPPNPWLYEAAYNANDALPAGESVSAVLFNLQSQVIRAIAGQEDAVIMGRCADHVLRGEQDVRLLSVFIAAPFPDRWNGRWACCASAAGRRKSWSGRPTSAGPSTTAPTPAWSGGGRTGMTCTSTPAYRARRRSWKASWTPGDAGGLRAGRRQMKGCSSLSNRKSSPHSPPHSPPHEGFSQC